MSLAARTPRLPQGLAACTLAVACLAAYAQSPATPALPPDSAIPAPPATSPALAATRAEATATRDAFVARVHAAGFTCTLPVPTLRVEDVPSFGQYDEDTNILSISDWSLLSTDRRFAFFKLAGPNASEAQAHTIFDLAAHRWILIHELGHWWQHCNGKMVHGEPWKTEFDADRVSLTYWREVDPTVVTRMIPIFHQVVTIFPDPTPPGQEMIPYFNANYEKLGPTPAYRWYQSKMNVAADDQRPIPTFPQVLSAIQH